MVSCKILQRMFVIFTLLLQITIIFYLLYSSSKASEIVSVMLSFISIIVAVLIAAKQDNEALCLLWIMWILAFPVFGGLMYLMFHFQSSTKSFRKMSNTIENDTRPLFFMSESSIEKALSDFPDKLLRSDISKNPPVFRYTPEHRQHIFLPEK